MNLLFNVSIDGEAYVYINECNMTGVRK
jgi:hypothetical protein